MNEGVKETLGLDLFLRNLTKTFTRQALAMLIGLGYAVLLARGLGPKGNGIYATAIILPNFFVHLFSLGVPSANVYFVGKRAYSIRHVLVANMKLWACIAVIGFIIALGVVEFFPERFFPGIPQSLLLAAALVFPAMLARTYLNSILHGQQDFTHYNRVLTLIPFFTLSVAAMLILLFDFGALGGVIAVLCAEVLALGYSLLQVQRHKNNELITPLEEAAADSKITYWQSCVRYGWKAQVSNMVTYANYRMDVFLINLLLSPSAAGVYFISVQIVERLWMLSQGVGSVLLPKVASLHQDEEGRRMLTPLVSRLVLGFTLVGALILAIVSYWLIPVIFGAAYQKSYVSLLFLLPGIVLVSLSRVLSNDISARGRPEITMYIAIVVFAVNGSMNLILIPKLGLNGAAIATTIAYLTHAILTVWKYSQYSQVSWVKTWKFGARDLALFSRRKSTTPN